MKPDRAEHDDGREHRPGPTVMTIFGAAGDLTRRKLVPALYNLFVDGWLPDRFALIGVDHKALDEGALRARLREGVDQFSRQRIDPTSWDAFARAITFLSVDPQQPGAFSELSTRIASAEGGWPAPAAHIFYLAIPPTAVETIVRQLAAAGLVQDQNRARVVIEKPFGRDLLSARALSRSLAQSLGEPQIYRIDHYLGKETVQNLLALRFANGLFEPVWDRKFVDHVQITVAEEVGVEQRGGYYDQAGALRDMVQNHLLQILCLVAMEPPVSFQADEIRSKKVDVLRAIRPLAPDSVALEAVRGQYGAGVIRGERVPAYRNEPNVARDSATETFAAVRFFVDNWRWQDVPFYVRTGKRLAVRYSEVAIQFVPAPHLPFPPATIKHWQPNHLIIKIQPDEGILLRFQAKKPGPVMHLDAVDMRFAYQEAFRTESPEAYETLLLDIMWGDATLFMRADQVEAAWSVVMPILDAWGAAPPADFPNYEAGTWGPEAAGALMARDGRAWLEPNATEVSPRAASG
jgi:glucose-6-phosphate 1-dehydrogenase